MSHCPCITCGVVVRDWDDPTGMPRGPIGLPPHMTSSGESCPDPRGDWTWNSGFNYWDDDAMEWRDAETGGPPREFVLCPFIEGHR